jgi:hypothetical protein
VILISPSYMCDDDPNVRGLLSGCLMNYIYLLLRVVLRDMEKDRDYCQLVRRAYEEQEEEEGEEVQGKKKIHFYDLSSFVFPESSVELRADELPLLIA